MVKYVDNINIENAKLRFKNFSGEETKFNRKGDRNFCVVIEDPDYAQALIDDGWNVKISAPRDEGDDPMYFIQVKVSFEPIPPSVYLITRNGKQELDEESIGVLDYAEIKTVDLTVRPYNWSVNGKEGVKAYLKTMYVTIVEDPFAHKYEDDQLPF